MKYKIIFAAAAFFLSMSAAFAQATTDSTIATGTRFLDLVGKGEDKEAWKLFDHRNVPGITADQFCRLTEKYVRELSQYDAPQFQGQDVTFIGGRKVNLYNFNTVAKNKSSADNVVIQVSFVDGSPSVAGMKWQRQQAPGFMW
jgi:uncharacterized protein YigE (DUF2233 family)